MNFFSKKFQAKQFFANIFWEAGILVSWSVLKKITLGAYKFIFSI